MNDEIHHKRPWLVLFAVIAIAVTAVLFAFVKFHSAPKTEEIQPPTTSSVMKKISPDEQVNFVGPTTPPSTKGPKTPPPGR